MLKPIKYAKSINKNVHKCLTKICYITIIIGRNVANKEMHLMNVEKRVQGNDKRARFVRIAETRVNRILENLDRLSNCSNKKNYVYTDEDVKKIFGELEKRLREVKLKFQEPSKDSKKQFSLEY